MYQIKINNLIFLYIIIPQKIYQIATVLIFKICLIIFIFYNIILDRK